MKNEDWEDKDDQDILAKVRSLSYVQRGTD